MLGYDWIYGGSFFGGTEPELRPKSGFKNILNLGITLSTKFELREKKSFSYRSSSSKISVAEHKDLDSGM